MVLFSTKFGFVRVEPLYRGDGSFFCVIRRNLQETNLTVARFIYLIAFNLSVAITSSFIGKAGSVEFILMFAMGLPFFIFFFSKGKNVYRYFSVVINGALVSSVRNRFQLVYNYEAGCPDGRKVHLSDFHSHHLNFHHLSIGVLFGE